MRYKYRGLIRQNIAPVGATKVVITDENGNRIGSVPLGHLTRPKDTKLYSFGLLSDIHCGGNNSEQKTRFNNALTYFEQQGCVFCCHSGDMTNVGFHKDDSANGYPFNDYQMAEYKSVIDAHPNLPVYGCCGNHESYGKTIECCVHLLPEYTNIPSLYYSMEYNGDVFLFISQPTGAVPMSNDALVWLQTTLEENKDRRCFLFNHSFVDDNDSGNPYGLYTNKTYDWWGSKKQEFINTMKKYKVIMFHGHSHMKPLMQEEIKYSNYSKQLGFHSVHVPACNYGRYVENGETLKIDYTVGYGYLVDVYADYIILNGFSVIDNSIVGIANYKIDI